jgi:hypothetical protein
VRRISTLVAFAWIASAGAALGEGADVSLCANLASATKLIESTRAIRAQAEQLLSVELERHQELFARMSPCLEGTGGQSCENLAPADAERMIADSQSQIELLRETIAGVGARIAETERLREQLLSGAGANGCG